MDKKTMLSVFGNAFLKSLVVMMGIAIVVFSGFFIYSVKANGSNADEQSTEMGSTYSDEQLQAMIDESNAVDNSANPSEDASTEEVTTEAQTTESQTIASTDKKIIVLNSTSVSGLAKRWVGKLQSSGFANCESGNYTAGTQSKTIIYVSEAGMGEDLLPLFSGASVQVGLPTGSMDVSGDGAEIIIVIGTSDSNI